MCFWTALGPALCQSALELALVLDASLEMVPMHGAVIAGDCAGGESYRWQLKWPDVPGPTQAAIVLISVAGDRQWQCL